MNLTSTKKVLENYRKNNSARWLTVSLILILVVFSICFVIQIKINTYKQIPGIIKSEADHVEINTPISGRLIWSGLKKNARINEGDTLLVIAQKDRLAKGGNEDLSILLATRKFLINQMNNLKASAMHEENSIYKTQQISLENNVLRAKINFIVQHNLLDEGISVKDYKKDLYKIKSSNKVLHDFIESRKKIWQHKKTDLLEQIRNLNRLITQNESEEKKYYILAPISGTILNSSQINTGSYIYRNKYIATISSANKLIVESNISKMETLVIKKNQKVQFEIDDYKYNQFGIFDGKVIGINKSALVNRPGVFSVQCNFNSTSLDLKSNQVKLLLEGKKVTAHYLIGRSSLADIIYPK